MKFNNGTKEGRISHEWAQKENVPRKWKKKQHYHQQQKNYAKDIFANHKFHVDFNRKISI